MHSNKLVGQVRSEQHKSYAKQYSHSFSMPRGRSEVPTAAHAGVSYRALLPCYQGIQDVRALGLASSHCVHHCSSGTRFSCHSAPRRDSAYTAASTSVPQSADIAPVPVAADSVHWLALDRFCDLHRGRPALLLLLCLLPQPAAHRCMSCVCLSRRYGSNALLYTAKSGSPKQRLYSACMQQVSWGAVLHVLTFSMVCCS